MKEQVLELINRLVNNVKEVFTSSADGSQLIIEHDGHGHWNIEAAMQLTRQEHLGHISQQIGEFQRDASLLDVERFCVIIKRSSGKTLIKNTLSPKPLVDRRAALSELFRKNSLSQLEHLVEDDPKWLMEILQERYDRSKNEEISQMINYLTQI